MKHSPTLLLTRWLDAQLESLPPGAPLPPDRELAERFGISRRTIARLCKQYARDGRLVRVSGKGTFVPAVEEADADTWSPTVRSSVQSLVDTVHGLIRSGGLKRGHSLPSVKFMRQRFRVSPTTVTRAYGQLAREGFVTKVGKTFWVGRFRDLAHPHTRKEVFVFLHKSTDFARIFQRDLLSQAYRKLQAELGFYGFVLRCETTANLDGLVAEWCKRRTPPYGLVFFGIDVSSVADITAPLARLAADKLSHTPPVVVDWVWGIPRGLPRKTFILSRPNLQTSSARAVAHYLVERGWRNVVVFSRGHLLESGSGQLVYDWLRLRTEAKKLDARLAFRLVALPSPKAKAPSFRWESVDRRAATRVLSKYSYTDFNSIRGECVAAGGLERELAGLDDRTMLVFREDGDAAAALEWLESHGRRVPDRIGVMGVENDPAYYHLGISCCEPDWDSVGYLMAHAVIGDFQVGKTHKGFIRVDSYVSERLTT